MTHFDTIVAPITGDQASAVAIVRLSGPDSWSIAGKVFRGWPAAPISHRAVYGVYVTGDDGLGLPFAQDSSYTGEESAELSLHGSPASVRALVEQCIQEGARFADAGEFTQRAFLNGRIDLTRAEAVADTVNALTATQLRLANRLREGALWEEVTHIRSSVLGILAQVEASVDFEEEIGPVDRDGTLSKIDTLVDRIEVLLKTAEIGRILRKGLRIAIVGPPNAGKSSLFNAFLGKDRAIVTQIPGTTRDYLEETLDLGGVPVVLIDTAGLRTSSDLVEDLGIQRAWAQAAEADLVWYVYDASGHFPDPPPELSEGKVWILANKSDLAAPARSEHYAVSALTADGLDALVRAVAEIGREAEALPIPPINERHRPLLDHACAALQEAMITIQSSRPDDLLATHLRAAIQSLGEVTGESAEADMIERIFSDFCIGK